VDGAAIHLEMEPVWMAQLEVLLKLEPALTGSITIATQIALHLALMGTACVVSASALSDLEDLPAIPLLDATTN